MKTIKYISLLVLIMALALAAPAALATDKLIPTAADFICDLSTVTYNGSPQGVTVDLKPGISSGDIGSNAVYYKGVSGTNYGSNTAPTDAGTYEVLISVTGGTVYAAATDIFLGTYTIARADGAEINSFAVNGRTGNSVMVQAAFVTATGQDLEVGYNPDTSAAAPVSWHTVPNAPTFVYNFSGLKPDTEYAFFARSKENNNYKTGDVSKITAFTLRTPTKDDFSYIMPQGVYNNMTWNVHVSTKYSGMGTLTRHYEGVSGTYYPKSTNQPSNAGAYEVSVDVTEGTEYSAGSGIVLGRFVIAKKEISIDAAATTIAPKTYDGTDAIPHASVDVKFTGTVGTALAQGTHYIIEDARFISDSSPGSVPVNDVGTDKKTVVEVRLVGEAARNYVFADERASITTEDVRAAITPKEILGVEQTIYVKAGTPHNSFDLKTLLPAIAPPMRFGTVSYTMGSVTDSFGIFSSIPIPGDILISPLNLGIDSNANPSDTATITVKITSDNFKGSGAAADIESTIKVVVTDKDIVTVSGVTVDTRAYNGQPVSARGTPEFSGATTPLTPIYTWKGDGGASLIPNSPPTVQGGYTLTVSAADDGTFVVNPQVINFTISPATLTVTADNQTIRQGQALPSFTYKTEGFAAGDSWNTAPAAGVAGTIDTNMPGTYPITFTTEGATASTNYTVNHVNGLLTIVPKSEACDVVGVITPSGASVNSTAKTITASVPYETSSLTVGAIVSEYAKFALFADAECKVPITGNTMTLNVGVNTAYVKVTAEDDRYSKVYALTVTRLAQGEKPPETPATETPPRVGGNDPYTPLDMTPFYGGGETGPDASGGTADVPSDWAKAAVNKALELKLIPARLQGKWQNDLNRADFCALAVKLYEYLDGKPITARGYFDDTTDENVQKLAGLGIVKGDGNGKFDPDGHFTREMALTLMYNMMVQLGHTFEPAEPSFADADSISPWAKTAIGALQKAGVVSGDGQYFNPSLIFTREMGILTVMNFLERLQ